MKNIGNFYLNFFLFWVVKFSKYLNRRVFVMLFMGKNHSNIIEGTVPEINEVMSLNNVILEAPSKI